MADKIIRTTRKLVFVFSCSIMLIAIAYVGMSYHFALKVGQHDDKEQLELWTQELSSRLAIELHEELKNSKLSDDHAEIAKWIERYLQNTQEENLEIENLKALLYNPQGEAILIIATRQVALGKTERAHDKAVAAKKPLLVTQPTSIESITVPGLILFAEKAAESRLTEGILGFALKVSAFLVLLLITALVTHTWTRRLLFQLRAVSYRSTKYEQMAAGYLTQLKLKNFMLSQCENLILTTDLSGKIQWCNLSAKGLRLLWHEDASNIEGRNVSDLKYFGSIQHIIEEALHAGEKREFDTQQDLSAQERKWCRISVIPMSNTLGKVTRLLIVISEIHDKSSSTDYVESMNHALILAQDNTIKYSSDVGNIFLNHWHQHVGEKLQRPSLCQLADEVRNSNQHKSMNVEIEKRLYKLFFRKDKLSKSICIDITDITEPSQTDHFFAYNKGELKKPNLNIVKRESYARNIQEKILTGEDKIKAYFKDAFAINKPREMVSGDFFWVHELVPKETYLLALGDCPGQGTAGGMLSIISHGILQDIVKQQGCTEPSEMLKMLNAELIQFFRQRTVSENAEGIDVAIVHIDLKSMVVTYAGALSTLYWMNGKLNVLHGDRHAAGAYSDKADQNYHSQSFMISKGDCLYLFSKGFLAQVGAAENIEIAKVRLQKMIEENQKRSMDLQAKSFEQIIEIGMSEYGQIDHASAIGIKF